jgi:hypothetical protein
MEIFSLDRRADLSTRRVIVPPAGVSWLRSGVYYDDLCRGFADVHES